MFTKLKRARWSLAALLALAALAAAGAIWNSRAAHAVDCSGDWWNSTDPAVLSACADQKNATTQQSEADLWAQKSQEPYTQTIPGSQPTTLLPQPDDTKTIQEGYLDGAGSVSPEAGALPPMYIGATSIWQAGSVPSSDYIEWYPLYIASYWGNGLSTSPKYSNDGNPLLATISYDAAAGAAKKYEFTWTCPKPIGKIHITRIVQEPGVAGLGDDGGNFAGLNYVVYFTNDGALGGTATGHFDLPTQTWTFDPPISMSITTEAEPTPGP